MIKITNEEIIFSSGRRRPANFGIIGIDMMGNVTEGYDGGFFNPSLEKFIWDKSERLKSCDLIELADFMIKQWTEFRKVHAYAQF